MVYSVAAVYKFFDWPDFAAARAHLYNFCQVRDLKGILLLAPEGINGTVAGSRSAITDLRHELAHLIGRDEMQYKESTATTVPFHRLRVRLKEEIVTMGAPEADPRHQKGTYVSPQEWDKFIEDPETIVIDTRNDYEVDIGRFRGAVNPKTQSFREFPEFVDQELAGHKDKRIAMYCTGGIRCEKATAYLLKQGFENVYHLEGGILKYLEEKTPDDSTWEGACFLFDGRVAVEHGLKEAPFELCHACRDPLSEADKKSPHYIPGVQCARCVDKTTPEQKKRFQDRQKQIKAMQAQGMGPRPGYTRV